MEKLREVLDKHALRIATSEYAGKRYIADKQKIADGFKRCELNETTGALVDTENGQVWVICIESENLSTHYKVN